MSDAQESEIRFELTDDQRQALEKLTGTRIAPNSDIVQWLRQTEATKGDIVMLIDWLERLTARVDLLTRYETERRSRRRRPQERRRN